MSKKVITVTPDMEVRRLAELFIRENVSGAPVVDSSGRFVGLVLEESLIFQDKKLHLPTFFSLSMGILALGTHQFQQDILKIVGTRVEDIMDKNPVVLSPDVDIVNVATRIVEKSVSYYPVVEGDRIVGVVTKRDFVRAIANGKI